MVGVVGERVIHMWVWLLVRVALWVFHKSVVRRRIVFNETSIHTLSTWSRRVRVWGEGPSLIRNPSKTHPVHWPTV